MLWLQDYDRERRARGSRDRPGRGGSGSSHFRGFAAGKSPRRIAAELNREGIPGPGGRPWGDTTIRGHALRGTGVCATNSMLGGSSGIDCATARIPATGRRVSGINPREDWIVRDVPELRIVDDNLWDRVQTRLGAIRNSDRVAKARATKFWTRRRPRHLLTGKAVCGICGGPAAPIGKDTSPAPLPDGKEPAPTVQAFVEAKSRRWIIEALRHQLMAPDLVSEFIRTFNDEVNRTRRDCGHRREGLQREQKDLERRIDTLLDAFASGALKGASVQAKLEALEARQGEVAKELAGLSDEPVRLHPNLADLYRRKVAALQYLLESDATRTEAVEIIRSLVDQVIFRPTTEAGLEVELVGDIAGMVHLAQNSNENGPISGAVHDEFSRSVKVVAGARFIQGRTSTELRKSV